MGDIKQRLISLESPTDFANVLTKQADSIREKIEHLTASLTAIEQLKKRSVANADSQILRSMQILLSICKWKNGSYYLIKRFDDDTLDHIRNRFDKESGLNFMDRFNRLSDEIIELQKASVSPESEKCQQVVKEYWGLIMEFTNGDMKYAPKIDGDW